MQRISVTLTLALLASTLLAGDPAVTDLGLLPGDTLLGAAANDQNQPAIAAGGTGFLVAWTDQRTEQTGRDIYAARLDAAGSLLDTTPIVVHDDFGTQETPRIAWNGNHWLVVWKSQEPSQFFYTDAYRAARIASDGTLVDVQPLLVHQFASSTSSMMTLASNGSDWLIVMQGTSAGEGGLLGVRLAADGTVVDATPVELLPATFFLYFNLEVVSAGGEYLLSWDASSNRRSQRFAHDLRPVSAEFATNVRWTGSDGSGYFGVWTAGGNLVGSRMLLDGTLVDPAGVPIASSTSANVSAVSVSWGGTRWWVSWDHFFSGLLAARIASDGTVLDPGGIPLEPAFEDEQGLQVSAAGSDDTLQVAYADRRAGGLNPDDVRALHVSSAGVPGASTVASLAVPSQLRPDVAAGGPGALAVFLSETSGSTRILAQRLDGSGMALDTEPLELGVALFPSAPRVSWNGARWLVVWSQDGSVIGRRVEPDGTVLDPVPPVLMPSGYSPDVAALGSTFLVVGTRPTISSHFVHPFFARVDGDTGLPIDVVPVIMGQYFARVPHVTTFGGRWLATWQRNFSHDDPGANVMAAFIEPDGTTSGEFFVGSGGGQPDVATTAATALFVWRTGTDSSSDPDLQARRMAPDGTFLDAGFPLADVPDKQLHPSVIWTGAEFLAAWEDLRNAQSFFDERTDIYAARVAEDGTILDPAAFALAAGVESEQQPVLAQVGGLSLAATSDFRTDAPYVAYRIGLHAVGDVAVWVDLEQGLAGSAGLSEFVGTGELTAGSPTTLALSGAPANGTTFLVVGESALSAPFKGGTLVPSLTLVVTFPLDTAGALQLGFAWPAGLPPGTATWWQHWIPDPGAPNGFAASNALLSTTP